MAFTIGLFIAFIALGISHVSLGPTLQGLAEQTGTAFGAISSLFVVRALGYMAGSFIGGRLYDRLPGKQVMMIALAGMGIALSSIPFLPSLWLVGLVMVLLGIGEGLLDVGGNTLLVWEHKKQVGPYMNALHFFFGLGALLAPLILAQSIIFTGSIEWTFWGIALLMLPPILWLSRVPGPDRVEVHEEESEKNANMRWVALLALMFFLYVGIEASFGGWIYSYATETKLFTAASAAYLNSGFWMAFTLGRLLGVPLSVRMTPIRQLSLSVAGTVLAVAIFILWSGSSMGVWVGSVVMGLAVASIFPLLMNIAGQVIQISGKVMGIFFLGGSAAGMIFPWVIGQFFESVGPVFMILMIAGLTAAEVIVFVVMNRKFNVENKGQVLPA